MVLSVAKVKKLALQKALTDKAKRAKITKRQIAKRKLPKPMTGKAKRAKLTKRQIEKRRAKGITTASVVNRPPVTANAATVKPKKPARGSGKKTVRWV